MSEYAFIHVPKCAGQSVKKALKDKTNIHVFDHGVIFDHIPDYLKQIIIIREPTSRFTSAFFYLKQWYCKDSKYTNPDMFIRGLIAQQEEASFFLKPQKYFQKVNGQRISSDWVFHAQTAWVDRPYKILLQEEDLEQGFREIGLELNIGRLNQSRKQDFIYSNESLEYLWSAYESDYILYNNIKRGDNESNYHGYHRTGWKPSGRLAP